MRSVWTTFGEFTKQNTQEKKTLLEQFKLPFDDIQNEFELNGFSLQK